MQLVEQYIIDRNDPRYSVIDEAAFKSKNLYNAANYELRQAFFRDGTRLNYTEMDRRMQSSDSYKALPAKVSQQVLVLLDKNWTAFFEARAAYKEPVQANVDPSFCVGIDLGVTNLAAIASSREGFVPRLVNGRPLKAWNQWYNKRMKQLKKQLPKAERERVTKQMERITNKRNRQINHYLHEALKRMIDFLVKEGVGTVIIGKNPLWKQEAGMGRKNNQNFVSIPHARFIDMLTYKAADEEAHTFSGKTQQRNMTCGIKRSISWNYSVFCLVTLGASSCPRHYVSWPSMSAPAHKISCSSRAAKQ